MYMNMQVSSNPRNLSQSRHHKDEEAFLRYSQLLEASTVRKMQVNRHNQKCRLLKSKVRDPLSGYRLEKLLWKKTFPKKAFYFNMKPSFCLLDFSMQLSVQLNDKSGRLTHYCA